jgi:hypothetical protein
MTMSLSCLLVAALLIAAVVATVDVDYVSVGKFSLKNAAFLEVEHFEGSEQFLLVSSFGALSSGKLYVVPGITAAVLNAKPSTLKPVQLKTPDFLWPNSVRTIPQDVFDGRRAIVVPDGFLPPGKGNGGVYVVVMDPFDITKTIKTVTLTRNSLGYFYHMGTWIDLNGDGRKDFLTAKTNAKPGKGQLVWLEHPEGGLTVASPWKEHVICSGPDVGIEVAVGAFPEYLDEVVVFASQFFDQKLGMYRVSTKDGSLVGSRIIDSTTLHAYGVTLVDLDSDGKKEIVINNHEKDDAVNGIWWYSIPTDLMTGDFVKCPIAMHFKNKPNFPIANMAPGFSYAVWPQTSTQGKGRAHILVAGDGDHSVSIVSPVGDASQSRYEKGLPRDMDGTIGALAFSDLDNNGWLEMWVPNYDKSYVELFKFKALVDEDTGAEENKMIALRGAAYA